MDRILGIASVLALCLANVNVTHAQSADALGAPTEEVVAPTEEVIVLPQEAPEAAVVVPPPPSVELVPAPPGNYGASVVPRVDVRPLRRQSSGYMPSWEFLAPGLAAFVSTYGGAVLTAAEFNLSGYSGGVIDWLYAPVIGPFVIAGESDDDFATTAFVVLGIVQAASLGLIVTGLAINRHANHDDDVAIHVAPMLGSGQAGLMATGRFF
jgi:hypothetical protein